MNNRIRSFRSSQFRLHSRILSTTILNLDRKFEIDENLLGEIYFLQMAQMAPLFSSNRVQRQTSEIIAYLARNVSIDLGSATVFEKIYFNHQ